MKFQNADQNRQLAAEYVLGTMRGAARRRFHRAIEGNDGLRWEVDFWEQRLSEFAQTLLPVAPPADSRLALQQAIGQVQTPILRPAASRRPKMSRRFLSGWGLAASLLIAFVIGRQYPQPAAPDASPLANAAVTETTPRAVGGPGRMASSAALPMYVASMRMPSSSMQWLISLAPNRRHLLVVAADDYLQIGRGTLELWWMSPEHGPVALGAMPVERDATTLIPIPEALAQQSQVTFSISVEPEGGSRSGQPTRSMVNAQSDFAI